MNRQFMKQKIWMKQPTKQNLEEMEFKPVLDHVGHYCSTMNLTHHRFFLDKGIDDNEHYRDLIQTLISVDENDIVELIVSNGGGNLETCMNIISAIRECSGTVRAIVTGACHSAASFITLACHEVAVLDFSTMMVHTASFGTFGKASEIGSHVQHMQKYLDKIIHEIYSGFLTEDEIQKLLSGVDFWFDAEEIRERLEKRQLILEKEHKKAVRELKKKQKEVKVKIEEKTKVVLDEDFEL